MRVSETVSERVREREKARDIEVVCNRREASESERVVEHVGDVVVVRGE